MPYRPPSACTVPGCPNLTHSGKCPAHRAAQQRNSDQQRGSAAARGYGSPRWQAIRRAQLDREPACALCGLTADVADHYPRSRRDLVAAGVADPDDLAHLRSLCRSCHSRETARHQPGGWNAQPR
jgi:5-methylcytosine-specific restriction enzyme A